MTRRKPKARARVEVRDPSVFLPLAQTRKRLDRHDADAREAPTTPRRVG